MRSYKEIVKLTAEAAANFWINANTELPYLEPEKEESIFDLAFDLASPRLLTEKDKENMKLSKAFFDEVSARVEKNLIKSDYCLLETNQFPVGILESVSGKIGLSMDSFPEFLETKITPGSIVVTRMDGKKETIKIE